MDKHRILIVDSSEEFPQALRDALEPDFLVMCCADGREALALIHSFQPHILVLELMLPSLDGLGLLEAIHAQDCMPTVITIARYYNSYTLQALTRLDVSYMMLKPCEIRAAADRIRDLDRMTGPGVSEEEDPEELAGKILLSLGFSKRHLGYHYLCYAIVSIREQREQTFTKELYPTIARVFNNGYNNVEHAIRTAIIYGWKRGDSALWQYYFPCPEGSEPSHPSNGTFIYRIADELGPRE